MMKELFGQAIIEFIEQFLLRSHFQLGLFTVYSHQFVEGLRGVIQALPMNVLKARHEPHGAFDALATAVNTIDDPLEYPHVFPKPGPHEFSLFVTTEPVYTEYARELG